ncbi:MATE family efflux transporter [Thalassotalea crassostreae]|uniref:MATE family efflux transporter n=1 Tax=Thalassotalea crassostreae TaxID=1763536 RepID=UPI000838BCD0|nr:MATE family efflux transporter [Thalassotalea crassostreae]
MNTKTTGSKLPPSIWSLAWPTTIANLLLASVGFIQIVMSTKYGSDATAAMTVSQRIFFLLQSALFGLSAGASAIIARHFGANEQHKAGQAFQSAMLISFIISLLLATLCFIYAEHFTHWFGMDEKTEQMAISFIKWICLFSPIYSLNIIIAGSLRASGDAMHPLLLAIMSSFGNAFGCYAFSTGSFGAPNLGVEGLIIGGVLGSIISLLFYICMWHKNRLILPFPEQSSYRKKTQVLLRIGMPSAVEQTIIQIGFLVFTIAVASYGVEVLAAYGLGLNVLTLLLITSLAFSMSGAVVVGQYLGRKEPEKAYQQGWAAWRICVAFMTFFGLIFFIFNHQIAAMLTTEEIVQSHTALFLVIIAFSMPLIATDFTIGGAIRGAGDTTYPLKVSLITLLLVRIILPFVFIYLQLSFLSLFILTAVDFLIKAVFMVRYFRNRKWQTTTF